MSQAASGKQGRSGEQAQGAGSEWFQLWQKAALETMKDPEFMQQSMQQFAKMQQRYMEMMFAQDKRADQDSAVERGDYANQAPSSGTYRTDAVSAAAALDHAYARIAELEQRVQGLERALITMAGRGSQAAKPAKRVKAATHTD